MEEKKDPAKVPGQTGTPVAGNPAGESTQTNTAKWRDVISKRKADLDMDDDDAVSGYLTEQFAAVDKAKEDNDRMNKLVSDDVRNARILSGIFSGKNDEGEPFSLVGEVVKSYYDELKGSTTKEEAIELINKKQQKEEEEAKEVQKKSEQLEANWKKMDEALTKAAEECNADKATLQELVDWLYGNDEKEGLYLRIAQRSVNEDDFTKLIHAMTRDKSLEEAMQKGRAEAQELRPGRVHRSKTDFDGPAYIGTENSGGKNGDEDEDPMLRRYRGMKPKF